jgi:alkylation response protein AidB-like acyl-CoA dehydrogenase
MMATPVQGGYRITGLSPFVSNCYDADWIAVMAMVMDGAQSRGEDRDEPEMVMAYFPSESCQIIDTWNVLRMRGTGSNDVLVTDVFVPRARTFPMAPGFEPGPTIKVPSTSFL